jgi:CMP-N,N'-diacetyllegionaminic acid synthase
MKILYLIPARAGSKGLPNKNIKLLNNKPLIAYSIEFALANIKSGDELCISTDDENVIEISEKLGVKVPFKRPHNLSSDTASTYDVIKHAINHYEQKGLTFDAVMLLQPTSPFRNAEDFKNVVERFDSDCEMSVSVKESKENPYFTLFEENEKGLLVKSKTGSFERRQDCPKVYAFNGSIYLIRVSAIVSKKINELSRIKKVIMPDSRSIDIDTMADWILAEHYMNLN